MPALKTQWDNSERRQGYERAGRVGGGSFRRSCRFNLIFFVKVIPMEVILEQTNYVC